MPQSPIPSGRNPPCGGFEPVRLSWPACVEPPRTLSSGPNAPCAVQHSSPCDGAGKSRNWRPGPLRLLFGAPRNSSAAVRGASLRLAALQSRDSADRVPRSKVRGFVLWALKVILSSNPLYRQYFYLPTFENRDFYLGCFIGSSQYVGQDGNGAKPPTENNTGRSIENYAGAAASSDEHLFVGGRVDRTVVAAAHQVIQPRAQTRRDALDLA